MPESTVTLTPFDVLSILDCRFGAHSRNRQSMDSHVVTISRFLVDQERTYPHATGRFTGLLQDIALAAKVISREVNKAGLVDILGAAGDENVHGEQVQKLDMFANDVMRRALDHTGLVACMASEENETFIPIPDKFAAGEYVVIFDPLDGSSNIDVNVSIGTIFSIHRKITDGERGTLEDCLQSGTEQVAAGYVLYGSSTMLVYTSGAGVHGFTLDPSIGEFLLSHPHLRFPEIPNKVYSVDESVLLAHDGARCTWTRRYPDRVRSLLRNRSELAKIKKRTERTVSLTDAGRAMVKAGIQVREERNVLTPDDLRSAVRGARSHCGLMT